MLSTLLLSLFLLTPNSPKTLTINFADYLSAEFHQEDCSFVANDIPFLFYDVYQSEDKQLICQHEEGKRLRGFKGQVRRADLPIQGKKVEIRLASIDCNGMEDLFEYELFYENGDTVKAYGESVTIKKFHKLEYLTFLEIECALTGIPGRVDPVVLELIAF